MQFFYVHDYRGRACFFSSGPLGPLPANFSRTRAVWETAKRKVTGLSPRLLLQEQAFELAGRPDRERLRLLHAGRHDARSVRRRLFLFLQRQRTRHIVSLALETVLVPITGLMAVLPGPNVFFYFLAILMIIQWQALRGINRTGDPRAPREGPRPAHPPQAPMEIRRGQSCTFPVSAQGSRAATPAKL
jgi:hypothetical protein